MLAIGLMSGTSLDGIDAVLVELEGNIDWRVLAFETRAYEPAERRRIHDAILEGGAPELSRLNAELGEWLAQAALAVCGAAGIEAADVDVIGSHGQTIWHEPPSAGRRGATLQLGCAATIAERTGIPVVYDFRARDVAAGGEGAPLVPWVDRTLFSARDRVRVLLNIGGIANLTRVPAAGSDEPLIAFDTGPGNALIDAAVERATGGANAFDAEGVRAAGGTVDPALLRQLLDDEYLRRDPPKSTGRERYGRPRVDTLLERSRPDDERGWDDLIATLTAFTAEATARAVRTWVAPRGADELIVTGGGARNRTLVRMLAERLQPLPVRGSEVLGVDGAAKEALAFAVLAWAHVRGVPANAPEATGAAGPRVLGSLVPGRARVPYTSSGTET